VSLIHITGPAFKSAPRPAECLAMIIVSGRLNPGDGARHYSDPKDPLQVAVSCYAKDHVVGRHLQVYRERPAFEGPTEKMITVQEGQVECQFWDDAGDWCCSWILRAGDVAVFYKGSHALTMLEPSVIVEVKQGPFDPEQDKVYL
jgi:hypothetical protein